MSASVRGERATSIRDLVDIAAISHFVAQMELAEHIGGAEPRFELSLPVVRFAAAEGVLEFPLRVLGSRSRDDLRWEWAWHTPGRYAPGLLGVVQQIRLKGLREAIPEITEPVVPVSAADALHLVIASKALSGVLTSYETEAAPGLTVHLLLGNANPRTPGPDRIAEAITEAVEAGCLHDHRTAIAAFAKRFQIPSRWSRERAILLAPGGSLDIEFDEQGRVDRIRLQGRDGPRALEGGGAQAAPAAAHPAGSVPHSAGSVPQPAPERPLALGGPPPVREAAGLLSPYPQPSGPPPPPGAPSAQAPSAQAPATQAPATQAPSAPAPFAPAADAVPTAGAVPERAVRPGEAPSAPAAAGPPGPVPVTRAFQPVPAARILSPLPVEPGRPPLPVAPAFPPAPVPVASAFPPAPIPVEPSRPPLPVPLGPAAPAPPLPPQTPPPGQEDGTIPDPAPPEAPEPAGDPAGGFGAGSGPGPGRMRFRSGDRLPEMPRLALDHE